MRTWCPTWCPSLTLQPWQVVNGHGPDARFHRRLLDRNADRRAAHGDLVAVPQFHLGMAFSAGLPGILARLPAAVLEAIDERAIAAAEVADPRLRRHGLQQEMVSRDQRVPGDPRMAVLATAEEERVMSVEEELLSPIGPATTSRITCATSPPHSWETGSG